MQSSELDYYLPESLIAQFPSEQRGDGRLLQVKRKSGTWSDLMFSDLPQLLKSGDVLVINNTRVLPAKFFLQRHTGGRIEGLWLHSDSDQHWQVLLRGASRLKIGEQ